MNTDVELGREAVKLTAGSVIHSCESVVQIYCAALEAITGISKYISSFPLESRIPVR